MAAIPHHRGHRDPGSEICGVLVWLLWSVVHVLLLISFRNKLTVIGEWIKAYL